MTAVPAATLDHWRATLLAGGITRVPRWSLEPDPLLATVHRSLPPALVARLRRVGSSLDVPIPVLLLAAHAKVLAALSGEADVVTGYVVGPGTDPRPVRLRTGRPSWRGLVADAVRAHRETIAHPLDSLTELQAELGLTEPAYEVVLDPAGSGDPAQDAVALAADTVLELTAFPRGLGIELRVRHRTGVVDAAAAERFLGYLERALTLLAADPDAEHGPSTLLSPAELDLQLRGLAGRSRPLPERRAHELFEERVRAQPAAVAAVHQGRSWSYAELNTRANRLGRALLARGLRPEGVVAVVTERNLDWAAAVLAIFKAGGVYLPIEPHFPAERIATTLRRADCVLALTETGSSATLDAALPALPGVQRVLVEQAYAAGHDDRDLDVAVGPDQLAYIYFTSGSTGEPKGAMCEHIGMLNHLCAKIDDLGIDADTVVAQTAPQCFDISLWQLVSALLVGGRTLIVPQETILDVERFVATIAAERVQVLQLVPSYLEVVLTYLDGHPTPLTDLRCVSVTGEAIKKELTQRWFAARPGLTLVNAYGLTETSDDTNHEIMHAVPDRDRVPLGPPISNVSVYVVDESLVPVPLGAPGQIVFSGVCVGRGYVNDPERTRLVYGTDPHRPGARLYQAGDFGRWLPEGKLEFLGRRDTQVKIRGFRIEIGEIENTLLAVPGIRDGAVVVADQGQQLVAFYAADRALAVDLLRDRLAASLPDYMVPSTFHWRPKLPLTANSKIDKRALTTLAEELAAGDVAYDAPASATEQRLAAAWADVLGVPVAEIGRADHFFDRGGSSLSAVKLAVTLQRVVSLRDITRHPVLADLAAVVDRQAAVAAPVSDRPVELLHVLGDPVDDDALTLIGFPYAGGNAVTYQALAAALRGTGLGVLAVELPGHDLGSTGSAPEPYAPLEQVVARVVAEVVARRLTRVLLWGHSAGTAYAVAAARALAAHGVRVERVFLGAQRLGGAAARRTALTELERRSDAELLGRLRQDQGFVELGALDAEHARHLVSAYRHDVASAHRALADALDDLDRAMVTAPVTVVVADDDPSTAIADHPGWERLAHHVEELRLPDGGHYFLRSRADSVARLVLSHVAAVTSA